MWAQAKADHAAQIETFNGQIAAARARFWATYPDKPGAVDAATRFAGMLRDKDL